MKKYGYTEIRKLYVQNIVDLCISHSWYSQGTNDEYMNLWEMIRNYKNIDCDALVEIATDIKEHSETDYEIEEIMCAVSQVCVSTFMAD